MNQKKTALEIVKEVYNCFAEGNIDGFLKLCAPDIEWVVNGPATLEKCQNFQGREGVGDFLKILGETWQFSSFTPREFIASEDVVVVLGEETGTDKKSNLTFENRWSHVFDLRDGQIVRFREFLCHWIGDEKPPATSWSSTDN
jgi:hypothetical protein